MKAINKDDLIIVLNAVKDRSTLDLNDLKTLLDEFGDEYFVEDGKFVRTTENESMIAVRHVEEFRPASKIIAEREESIKSLHKDIEGLMYEHEKQRVKITELEREIKAKSDNINKLKLIYLKAKQTEVDILKILREYNLTFEITCDWELHRYVITLVKEINDHKYKINYSYPYSMYDMLQDSIKCDQIKDVILTMIQRLNERIEKWPDEDTEIIYEYDGIECSREKPAL